MDSPKGADVDFDLKERAIDEAPVGIAITDLGREDNPLVYVNERFEEVTGYDRSEVLGRNCRFTQGEDTDPATVAEIREAVDARRPVSVDILNYRKNGRTFWNKLDIAPVRDDDGTVTNYVGFQMDITERKIRERRLEVLNRVLSHNMRNKMNVIEGHISLLKRELDREEPPESLDEVESTAADLMSLADTVREIEQAFSGTESSEPIELTEQLERLVSTFTDQFSDATFELTYPGVDGCRVDVPGFVAAVEEAVDNAVKHNDNTEPRVEIRVTGRSEDWVDVDIEDDGPGIPDQELEVLSEGETPLTHANRLGLWFIHWVVSRAGGQLSVTESDPRGTTLTVSVPRYRER